MNKKEIIKEFKEEYKRDIKKIEVNEPFNAIRNIEKLYAK